LYGSLELLGSNFAEKAIEQESWSESLEKSNLEINYILLVFKSLIQ